VLFLLGTAAEANLKPFRDSCTARRAFFLEGLPCRCGAHTVDVGRFYMWLRGLIEGWHHNHPADGRRADVDMLCLKQSGRCSAAHALHIPAGLSDAVSVGFPRRGCRSVGLQPRRRASCASGLQLTMGLQPQASVPLAS